MWILIIALTMFIFLLLGNIIYKARVINELEVSKSEQDRRRVSQIVDMLNEIKDIINTYEELASRDTQLRNYLNNKIEKYAGMYRTHEFDDLVKAGCEEYIKKN